MRTKTILVRALAVVCPFAVLIANACASNHAVCHRVLSPSGRDSAAGTAAHPWHTLGKLLHSLRPSQVGCLRAGTYGGPTSTFIISQSNITITSYPGARATIQGWPVITGNRVTISYLAFDLNKRGDAWPALCKGAIRGGADVTHGLDVDGNYITLEHNDISIDPSIPLTERGGAIGVGLQGAETTGNVLRYNRIHDVGFCPVEEHGIYLYHTHRTQIYANWIYDIAAGTGVQVWDGTSDAHITANIVDNASSCFDVGGESAPAVRIVIKHNICSNMAGLQRPYKAFCEPPRGPGCTGPDPGQPLFDRWGGSPLGRSGGDVMRENLTFCAIGTHCSTSYAGTSGVVLSGNISANPGFADPNYRQSHDYRLGSSSPAASWGIWNGSM